MSTCKDLDRLLEYFVETGLPGCSLMICRKGDVIYEGHAGYANVDNKEKIRPDSIMHCPGGLLVQLGSSSSGSSSSIGPSSYSPRPTMFL